MVVGKPPLGWVVRLFHGLGPVGSVMFSAEDFPVSQRPLK